MSATLGVGMEQERLNLMKDPFARVASESFRMPISPEAKVIYAVLADFMGVNPNCWPSHDTLGALAFTTSKPTSRPRKVIKAIKELELFGMILKKTREGKKSSNIYYFCDLADWKKDSSNSASTSKSATSKIASSGSSKSATLIRTIEEEKDMSEKISDDIILDPKETKPEQPPTSVNSSHPQGFELQSYFDQEYLKAFKDTGQYSSPTSKAKETAIKSAQALFNKKNLKDMEIAKKAVDVAIEQLKLRLSDPAGQGKYALQIQCFTSFRDKLPKLLLKAGEAKPKAAIPIRQTSDMGNKLTPDQQKLANQKAKEALAKLKKNRIPA